MKKLTFLTALFCLPMFVIGQQTAPTFERCATLQFIEYQNQKYEGYKESVDEQFYIAKNAVLNKSDEVFTIPVVVHIVYHEDKLDQNLDDEVIQDQIRTLNEDFMALNEDGVNLREEFEFIKGTPNIQFKLADFDPEGNPTTGITRTSTTISFGMNMQEGMDASEKVKQTSKGGIDPWDQSKYLNIWVCDMAIDLFGSPMIAVLGYATPPAGLPNWPPGSTGEMSDGVVIQYQVFGSINPYPIDDPNYVKKGRTVSHEVGHYLGLRHIWGDGDCTEDDGIDDTPNSDDQSGACDKNKNKCVDDIYGIDLPDMVENFMDYSPEDCQNSFTEGQVELMRGVLENQRYDLVHDNDALSVAEEMPLIVSLYPNPTTDRLNIIQNKGKIKEVKVISMNGQEVVVSSSVINDLIELNVSALSQGVYFVQIVGTNEQMSTHKFVKE